jgi:hypothetical protein
MQDDGQPNPGNHATHPAADLLERTGLGGLEPAS